MTTAAKDFFASPRYAVVGASQNPEKFGYKVLAWYHARSLPVQPVTPSRPAITVSPAHNPTVPPTEYLTVPSPSTLPFPRETSLSIVTPPSITLRILREAKEAGIPAVWLQPGSFDEEGLEYAKREFAVGIGGRDGMDGRSWCVLVNGDEALNAVRKENGEIS